MLVEPFLVLVEPLALNGKNSCYHKHDRESAIALVIPGTCAADTWMLSMLHIMNKVHNKYMTGGDLLVPAEMVSTMD